jgi:hypothetical protein
MAKKKLESLEQSAQSECLELLIEFLSGLQRIPQKYCLLCGAKTARRLDIGCINWVAQLAERRSFYRDFITVKLFDATQLSHHSLKLCQLGLHLFSLPRCNA